MDPTRELLTISTVEWSALFEGLTEGMLYGFSGVACALAILTALLASLGRRREPNRALATPSDDALPRTTAAGSAAPRTSLLGIVPALPAAHHSSHARRRRRRLSRASAV